MPNEKPKPIPGLDWAYIDIEQFRGEGLSFPVQTQVVISPAFTTFTLGSARNFVHYFRGSILDPEEELGIRMLAQLTVNGETAYVNPTDICLVLTYIDGTETVIVIDPTPVIH